MELALIKQQAYTVATEIITIGALKTNDILVVGCSTSEVIGENIGTAGSAEVAANLLAGLMEACLEHDVFLAIQCCEHLNRALVVEQSCCEQYLLEKVNVKPVARAGGALADSAMKTYKNPVVVEIIVAHAGVDIGATLIGMHLKKVAVPVRLSIKNIGAAMIIAARTRPKYIGGHRAQYEAL